MSEERRIKRAKFGIITPVELERKIKKYYLGIEETYYDGIIFSSEKHTKLECNIAKNVTVEDLTEYFNERSEHDYDKRCRKKCLPEKLLNLFDTEAQSNHEIDLKDYFERLVKRFPSNEPLGRYLQFKCREFDDGYQERKVSVLLYDIEPFDIASSLISDYKTEMVAFLPTEWPKKPGQLLDALVTKIQVAESAHIPNDIFARI